MVTEVWLRAFPLQALPRGEARVVLHGGQRIAVFHLADGQLAAIDDRCPHEGYPLAKGFVNGCVVTCRWHAFRYDLKSGRCLVGDEHARVYAVRVVDGVLEVDVAVADAAAERAKREVSLRHGLERRRVGQIARDVVRLLDVGVEPYAIAMHAVRFDALRAPYGITHVAALAHDVLGLLPRIRERHGADGEVAALLCPLELAAEGALGYPDRARPEPEAWPIETAGAELRRRVEAEDADGAEALVRGAVAAGVPAGMLRGWFLRLVTDHLLDFGHAQIYFAKVFGLLGRASSAATGEVDGAGGERPVGRASSAATGEVDGAGGGERPVGRASAAATDADDVLAGFVRQIALATREELVPEWGWVVRAIDEPARVDPIGEGALSRLLRALLDGSRRELCEALEVALATKPLAGVIDALVVAASVRLLRYDLQVEHDPTIQEGWLDCTHALTVASAMRDLMSDDAVANRRVLYLAAAFVHTRGGLDAPPDLRAFDESALFGPPDPKAYVGAELARPEPPWAEQARPLRDETAVPEILDDVHKALEHRDADAMVRIAQPLAEDAPEALIAALEDQCLLRGAARPIFNAHQWKTLVCAAAESRRFAASPEPALQHVAPIPLLAAARFIAAPLSERAPVRLAHEAIRFVRDARVPRKRT